MPTNFSNVWEWRSGCIYFTILLANCGFYIHYLLGIDVHYICTLFSIFVDIRFQRDPFLWCFTWRSHSIYMSVTARFPRNHHQHFSLGSICRFLSLLNIRSWNVNVMSLQDLWSMGTRRYQFCDHCVGFSDRVKRRWSPEQILRDGFEINAHTNGH